MRTPTSRAPLSLMPKNTTWKDVAIVTLAALAVLVAGDLLAARFAPPRLQTELNDALANWAGEAPTTLVLGSSHARTFETVARTLEDDLGSAERVLALPVEFGKLSTYLFVLKERIAPILERSDQSPDRLVLVTEWWDSTAPPGGALAAQNLPSRAWSTKHWASDVLANGTTPFSRNFVQERWRRLFPRSSLVQDHGHGRIYRGLVSLAKGESEQVRTREFKQRVKNWQGYLREAEHTIFDPEQMAAFDEILDLVEHWEMDITVLLYPRMPATITDYAVAHTLAPFSEEIERLTTGRGHRFLDLTQGTPLKEEHFEPDLDHVTRDGNELFAEWSLAGPLGFLRSSTAGSPAEESP